jgi:hypothetical protein
MPEIPDLSKLNGQQPPAPEEKAPVRVTTAFLVIVQEDGAVVVSTDLAQPMEQRRVVTPDDIYAAVSIIRKDIVVQQTAALTQQGMLQMGAAMQQQMRSIPGCSTAITSGPRSVNGSSAPSTSSGPGATTFPNCGPLSGLPDPASPTSGPQLAATATSTY